MKKITASCSQSRLQKRYRDYNTSTRVEDIYAEHITEDELVAMVKFIKQELLGRYKRYNLESTRKNILKIKAMWTVITKL